MKMLERKEGAHHESHNEHKGVPLLRKTRLISEGFLVAFVLFVVLAYKWMGFPKTA
jgi:hypothetical protein